MANDPRETILQFGTGKFLRAFADLFVHELAQSGKTLGRVVALQSTGSDRARAFNEQGGRFHVAIRGLDQARRVDRTVEVRSVSRALTAASDWEKVLDVARSPSLCTIISNTTEAGYELDASDRLGDAPPRSFPARLLAVLKARFEAGQPGVTVLPCELLEGNGDRLLRLVVEQAERWGLPETLIDWLRADCSWHNTLVDRIVSAPPPGDPLGMSDPLFAVAEPFALWLIQGSLARTQLGEHPAVEEVEKLEPYYLRKVRILNGAHTALVAKARPLGFETVREAALDPDLGPWLESLLMEEIVPVLEGRTEGPRQFALDTLERFANPFLEHRLADIALHHDVKLRTRLVPTLDEFRQRFGRTPKRLGEIVG
jgi:tagaturonate reductase